MKGWDQEVFFALFSSAKLKEKLEMDPELIVESYNKAYQYRPSRAEPLYYLTRHYVKGKNYALGYILSKFALEIPLSKDLMPVETWIYEYGLLFEFARCADEMGFHAEAAQAYEKLLQKKDLPREISDYAKMGLRSTKLKILYTIRKK